MNLHVLISIPLASLSWDAPALAPLVSALLAALVLAAVVLYWPQARSAPAGWRWVMTAFRALGLGALALSILKPVIERPARPEDLGAVVVLVDHSRGSDIVDRRSSAQLVALADGLGRIPPGLRSRGDNLNEALKQTRARLEELNYAGMNAPARLPQSAASLKEASQLLLKKRAGLRPKSALVELLSSLQQLLDSYQVGAIAPDAKWISSIHDLLDRLGPAIVAYQVEEDARLYSTNKQVAAMCNSLRKLDRLGLIEQSLLDPMTGLLAHLPPRVPVFGFSIGDKAAPLALQRDGKTIDRLMISPVDGAVDSSLAIRQAIDQLPGVPVQAVVLFSPGRRSGAEPPITPAHPVFAVTPVTAFPGRDLAITNVQVPVEVALGSELNISAVVRAINLTRNGKVEVRMRAGPSRTPPPLAAEIRSASLSAIASNLVAHSIDAVRQMVVLGDDNQAAVSFTTRFTRPGPQQVTLEIDRLNGELDDHNNTMTRWINVVDEPIHVAILGGSPGWEFRHLRNLLDGKVGFALQAEVVDDGSIAQIAPQNLLNQQLVILYDLAANALDAKRWEAIHQLVSVRGGSLMLIAGPDHLPADYLAPGLASDLLPFRTDQPQPGQNQVVANWKSWLGDFANYQLLPTTQPDAPLLGESEAQNHRRWNSLPPIYSYLALPPLKPEAETLLVERVSQMPVITERRIGLGRVLFCGANETWRWRNPSRADYQQAWLELIRSVTTKPYATSTVTPSGRFSLDLPAAVTTGEQSVLRARLLNDDGSPASRSELGICIMQAGKSISTISLIETPANSGRFTGNTPQLPTGEYQVDLLDPASATAAISRTLRVVPPEDQLGAQDLVGNRPALTQLSDASGGETISLEQVSTLPDRLAAHRSLDTRPVALRLWDSGYLFIFVIACFSAEWGLRKRFGLA